MDICIRKEKVIVYHPSLFFLKSWIPVWKVFHHLCNSKVLQPAGCPETCFQTCICICCSCSTSTLLLSFQSYVLESSHYFQSFLNFPRMYWRQMYIKIFLLPSLSMFSSLTISKKTFKMLAPILPHPTLEWHFPQITDTCSLIVFPGLRSPFNILRQIWRGSEYRSLDKFPGTIFDKSLPCDSQKLLVIPARLWFATIS